MANFVKCKQEFVKFKRTKRQTETKQVKSLFFFTRTVETHTEIPDEDGTHVNSPMNLDIVKTISKISHVLDRNSGWSSLPDGKKKFGINFNTIDGNYHWYYDEEKNRDEQFEEIAGNTHLYKSKVSI
jgi:hypothetical protein